MRFLFNSGQITCLFCLEESIQEKINPDYEFKSNIGSISGFEKSNSLFEKMRLKRKVKSLPHYARIFCPDGNSTFSVHRVKELSSGEGVIVYFECEDPDAYVNLLIEKSIRFEEFPSYKSWLWREAKVKDLDGNRLVLFNGGVNRLNPPWKLGK